MRAYTISRQELDGHYPRPTAFAAHHDLAAGEIPQGFDLEAHAQEQPQGLEGHGAETHDLGNWYIARQPALNKGQVHPGVGCQELEILH